ncbi:MAG: acyl-CoA dehydrogenase family protein [Actinomycetota bacterium]|nr:acyl-CoA dehydrogenase family protein [Actinomycetota bacterium]
MELRLPGDDHPERQAIRAWLEDHPDPTGRQMAEAGYVAPHWPRPWGLAADPVAQLVIDDELRRAGARRPINPIGIGWAGPTIIHAGTPDQQRRWIMPMLAGEEFWCQLFSEPSAGSDLASLSTRAVRDGDEWVVSGQKVWTTFAHVAKFGILLARTNPEAPKHRGISYFVCPMDAAGIEIRPLVDMTGEHAFNEVFFDEVRIPSDHLVGAVNGGWELAKVTLGNERVSLSGEGSLWGNGPTASDLVDQVRRAGGAPSPYLRQRLARVWAEGEILRTLRLRTLSAHLAGRAPGPEASVRKALADAHGQQVLELARDLAGPFGTLSDGSPTDGWGERTPAGSATGSLESGGPAGWDATSWARGFLFSPALTIGGGTAEVQRNIVAERVLGLPRDPVLG